MKINYIYHSCFVIETGDFSMIIDYFKDSGKTSDTGMIHDQILHRPEKLYVLSSHVHSDHFNPEILKWKEIHPDIQFIFSSDIREEGKAKSSDAVFLKKYDVFSDESITVKAFGSTDAGISFSIEAGGKKIFHAGDLNNWHWNEEASPEYAKEAELFFLKELDDLHREEKHFDVAMFPVDNRLGKDYMKGPRQFIDRINAGLFLPMHFGENYDEGNAFEPYAESKGCRFGKITCKGQSFTI
ncbi:MAG: MBL fold metallo-hydrolase [Candidatus Azobacteroides sp.]|nr:MBL fold metallo-hydrolase [Candidatus Azobacteroides sp.]